LHVADEDEQLAPRLAGRHADVDRALATMAADHLAHEPAIRQLVGLCATIADDPAQLATAATELASVTANLATTLESHLELEERAIFPHVRRLPIAEQEAIRCALRDRRAQPLDVGR
jgi:iron-sulfur cluster repair protein YtfE (RIC family)